MKYAKRGLIFIVLIISTIACRVQLEPVAIQTFEQKLSALFPNAEISKMELEDHFTKRFKIVLDQPLDHGNLDAGTFKHYIYLSHVDVEMPTIFVTEGYNARPRTYELSKIFKGNQVQVEYRFYGNSRPDSIPWQYLTNDQAVEDYHKLITKLRRLYKGKWISTGISKGGETVLIHKSKYPWDVEVAVAYVAPLIHTVEDPRTQAHIYTVGSDECRAKIESFQRLVLENRESVLVEMKDHSELKKMQFTELSLEEALEFN